MATHSAPQAAGKRLRLADHRFGPDVASAVGDVLASGHLTLGPRVAEFERSIADRIGVRRAVAVSSGTAALHLAIVGLGIGRGDEVVVPDFTHPATGHVVLQQGARPVLADVDPITYNIDPASLRKVLTRRTRLVIAVDLFGLPADYAAIEPLLEARGIPLLCDAACSLGAEVNGEPSARRGRAATFSFHPRKILTTGEGGTVVTDDVALAARLERLRNHGLQGGKAPHFDEPGYNYRLSDVLAVIGSAQVPHLDEVIERRNALSARLTAHLDPLEGIRAPAVPQGMRSTFQAYVAVLAEGVDRVRFIAALADHDVEATIGTYALHAQPSFRQALRAGPDALPVSQLLSRRTVALPLHPGMTAEDTERVARAVREGLEQAT